jgi:hypothetical protein
MVQPLVASGSYMLLLDERAGTDAVGAFPPTSPLSAMSCLLAALRWRRSFASTFLPLCSTAAGLLALPRSVAHMADFFEAVRLFLNFHFLVI